MGSQIACPAGVGAESPTPNPIRSPVPQLPQTMMSALPRFLLAAFVAMSPARAIADATDPYLWLEDIEGERALDWVRTQNALSQAQLEADSRFAAMHAEARAILTSKERIAYGEIHAGHVYNFWQDETAVRGIWRRAEIGRASCRERV